MSLTSLKPQSTLGQICPGTWLRCMSSAPHTQTSSGRWATRGEHSRSETGDVTAVQSQLDPYHPEQSDWFSSCFSSAARVEKAAGHHRAPPAEAGSVRHVQQQQVVQHSSSFSSHHPIICQVSSTGSQRRGDLACSTLITMAIPPLCLPPTVSPIPTHLPSCPVPHKRAMQQQHPSETADAVLINKEKKTCTSDWQLYAHKQNFSLRNCVQTLGTFHSLHHEGQILWF